MSGINQEDRITINAHRIHTNLEKSRSFIFLFVLLLYFRLFVFYLLIERMGILFKRERSVGNVFEIPDICPLHGPRSDYFSSLCVHFDTYMCQ